MSSFDHNALAKKRRAIELIGGTRKKPPMHSGRWTPEEEEYVQGMITEFNAGLLPIADGTTLRSFLAKMLNCNPKRVSKKYDGHPIYNGKSAYVRSKNNLPPSEACARQENLLELERKFREALCTMRRVESRLQSLTSHLMPPEKKSKNGHSNEEPTWEDSWRSSSAVSSLTEDDPDGSALDQDLKTAPNKIEESLTLVTQISDHVSQSTDARRSSSTAPHTASEETVSQVLLQLNAATPSPVSAAASGIVPVSNDIGQRTSSNQFIAQTQAPAAFATNQFQSPGQFPTAGQDNSCNGELQGLLQKLAQVRQQSSRPQQQPAAATPCLQNMLSMPQSPLLEPQNAQQNLQQLLQTLQQQQQQNATAVHQQQNTAAVQQNQQQGVSTIMQLLRQEGQPKSEINLQGLLGVLGQANVQAEANGQAPQTAQVKQGGDKVLGNAFRQIIGNNNARSNPPQLNPFPPQHQENLNRMLQSLIDQQQAPPPPPPPRQQQQQHESVEAILSKLVEQLQQRQQQQTQHENAVSSLVQALLSSAGGQLPQQQQAKPPPTPASQQKSLQQLLMELQQTRVESGNGNHFQM